MKFRSSILEWSSYRRGLRRWTRMARTAPSMRLGLLRQESSRARKLRYSLNELISVAENRLALPMIGSSAVHKPHGSDWSWRPKLWREPLATPGKSSAESQTQMGSELKLFHDCGQSELTLRQIRNSRERDLAAFGLRMDVFSFDGSFLSLVLDLPEDAITGLTKKHILRLETIIELEKNLEIFARLNVRHGPNTEQMVRELQLDQDQITCEFDLAYTNINEKRIEGAWIDLIFENPQMSQVVIRDLTFSRRRRAEF